MKKSTIFFIFIFFILSAFSQKDTIIGKAYRNIVDYKNDKPIFESECMFKMSYTPKYSGSYKLKILDKRYRNIKKKSIWIITDGTILYLNAKRHAFDTGFLRLELTGNYLYFYAIPLLSVVEEKKIVQNTVNFGIVGGAVTYNKIQQNNEAANHNVLNLNKGSSSILNEQFMLNLLNDYPELPY